MGVQGCFRMRGLKMIVSNPPPISALGVKSPHLQLWRVKKLLCSKPTSSNTTSLSILCPALHPIPITRFRYFRTQPLESLSAAVKLPINKRFLGNQTLGSLVRESLVMGTGCRAGQRMDRVARSRKDITAGGPPRAR